MWNIFIIILVAIAFVLAFAATNKYFKTSLTEYFKNFPQKTAWGLWRWAARHEKHGLASDGDTGARAGMPQNNVPLNARSEIPPGKSKIRTVSPQTSHKPRKGI